jgi:hypothetical protein
MRTNRYDPGEETLALTPAQHWIRGEGTLLPGATSTPRELLATEVRLTKGRMLQKKPARAG